MFGCCKLAAAEASIRNRWMNSWLEYSPKSRSEPEEVEPGMTSINERMTLILESGKPLVISQAADPTSDRKITVEVTATILR